MPIYDFKCPDCGYKWEHEIRLRTYLHDLEHTTCPICKAQGEKQPSAPSFVIKGYSEKNGYSK